MAPANIYHADFSSYEQRSKAFAVGKAELKENLLRIDKCCEELHSAVNLVVGKLLEFREESVAKLLTWRASLSADIDAAVAEVENSLAKESVQLHSKYSEQLRSFQPGSLVLFRYSVSTSWLEASVRELLCTEFMPARPLQDIARQTFGRHSHDLEMSQEVVLRPRASSEPFESSPPHFVQLSKQHVRFFSFRLNSWEPAVPLRQAILFDSRTTFVQLRLNCVFACGSEIQADSCGAVEAGTHKEAYCIELSANQAEVRDFPPLIHQRGASGLALDLERVFVFGCKS